MSAMTPEGRVALAEVQAKAARERLGGTMNALRHRVSPRSLAQDAADTLKDKSVAIAADIRRNPATFAAVAGGLALFFARRQIFGLFRRADTKTSSTTSQSNKGSSK